MVGAIRGQARSAGEAFGLASHVRGGRWEHWGELPFGYDVALLEACSQAAPSTAARLHRAEQASTAARCRVNRLVGAVDAVSDVGSLRRGGPARRHTGGA